jgi:hypothetical protein
MELCGEFFLATEMPSARFSSDLREERKARLAKLKTIAGGTAQIFRYHSCSNKYVTAASDMEAECKSKQFWFHTIFLNMLSMH